MAIAWRTTEPWKNAELDMAIRVHRGAISGIPIGIDISVIASLESFKRDIHSFFLRSLSQVREIPITWPRII